MSKNIKTQTSKSESIAKTDRIMLYAAICIASLIVIGAFLTATNYAQLAIAAMLYPIVVYFILKTFPRRSYAVNDMEQPLTKADLLPVEEGVEVSDEDRRRFLKLIGAAGVSVFLLSVFSKKSQVPFFGKIMGPSSTQIEDKDGNKIDPAQNQPTDGYRISEVDDNIVTYYGFIKTGGQWFIMREDTQNGSFRYAKGNNAFPGNWNNREKLSYDYYSNVF